MKNYMGLVPRSLRQQWKRSLLVVIGILLSVSLMIFILTFMHNLREYKLESTAQSAGDYHVQFTNLTEEQRNVILHHTANKSPGTAESVYVKISDKELETRLMVADSIVKDMFNIQLLSGRMPESEREIVLEQWVFAHLNLEEKPGQTILIRNIPFKIVGIQSNQKFTKSAGITFGLISKGSLDLLAEKKLKVEESIYVTYDAKFADTAKEIERLTVEIQEQNGISSDKIQYNQVLLAALDEYHRKDYSSLLVILLNSIATIIAIYNVLHISVVEKTRYYGVLRSIGATSKQVRRLVLGEAFLLSVVAIPLGLLFGLSAVKFSYRMSFANRIEQVFSIPFDAVVITTLSSLITILAAAIWPANFASRISPLEALKTTSTLLKPPTKRQGNTKNWLKKRFGISAHMAYQNITRNRKVFMLTTLSMSIGIVLFIVNGFYVNNQNVTALIDDQFIYQSDYYIKAGSRTGLTDKEIAPIKGIPGVQDVIQTRFTSGYSYLSKDQTTESFHSRLLSKQEKFDEAFQRPERLLTNVEVYGYDSETLLKAKPFLIAGSINPDRLRSGEEILLFVSSSDRYVSLKTGDTVEIGHNPYVNPAKSSERRFQQGTVSVRIGGIIEDFYASSDHYEGLRVVLHEDFFRDFTGLMNTMKVDIISSDDADKELVESRLKDISKQLRSGFTSYEVLKRSINNEIHQVTTLLYYFIGIITLIGVLGIVNSITTSLLLRVREFGILRAIGMTDKQLREMVRIEGLMYGLISSIWGLIAGGLFSYVMYRIVTSTIHQMTWQFPWLFMAIAAAATVLISVMSTIMPMKRVGSIPVIEAVKSID